MICRLQSVRSGIDLDIAVDAFCLQIGPGTENAGTAGQDHPGPYPDARDLSFLRDDLHHFRLPDPQVRRVLQNLAHGAGIGGFIRLGAQGMDGRSL